MDLRRLIISKATITPTQNAVYRIVRALCYKQAYRIDKEASRLDLTAFLFYFSKITSNLPENYMSKSKTTS